MAITVIIDVLKKFKFNANIDNLWKEEQLWGSD